MLNRILSRPKNLKTLIGSFSVLNKQNSTQFQKDMGLHNRIVLIHQKQLKNQKKAQIKITIPLIIAASIVIYYLINNDKEKKKINKLTISLIFKKIISNLISVHNIQSNLLISYYSYTMQLKKQGVEGFYLFQQLLTFLQKNRAPSYQQKRMIFEIIETNIGWLKDKPNKLCLEILKKLLIKLKNQKEINYEVFKKICYVLMNNGDLQGQYLGISFLQNNFEVTNRFIAQLNKNIKDFQYLIQNKKQYEYLDFKFGIYQRQLLFILKKIYQRTFNAELSSKIIISKEIYNQIFIS